VPRRTPDSQQLAFYEGLVRRTAAIYCPRIDDEYEDVVAILRVKVWRSLNAYDPSRSRLPVERYVFSCVANQVKDLLKRKRRHEVYIDDVSRTTVDGDELMPAYMQEFLSIGHDEVFGDVEAELPEFPESLSELEREVVVRLYLDNNHRRIAVELNVTRMEIDRTVDSIRVKMAEQYPAVSRQPIAA
jgi:RNA polymerase sigma factor (sigma-70 family)